jgi:hypothetical protein
MIDYIYYGNVHKEFKMLDYFFYKNCRQFWWGWAAIHIYNSITILILIWIFF